LVFEKKSSETLTPLKILHVISIVAPRYGGPGIASQLMAHYQAKSNHKVTLCTTNVDYPAGILPVPKNRPVNKDGVSIVHFDVSSRSFLFSAPMMIWMKKNISSFDIVHIHGLYRFPVTFAAWLARRSCIPYLICPHGSLDPFIYKQSQYNVFLKRIYERLFDLPNLNNATAIHFTAYEEYKRTAYLKLRARPIVVPNGIDWERYKHLPAKNGFRKDLGLDTLAPLVLFLGRINFKKGLDLLIPAFSFVASNHVNAHLAIVGPDNEGYRTQVSQWCNKYGIQKRVFFVDHLGIEKVKEAYVDSDVFVLPSYTENFGLTVVESMVCQTPVVISDQVNIWHQVQKAGAGIVVNCDTNSVANAINYLLNNPDEAKSMGVNGRIAAKESFSWSNITLNLTKVYRNLINQRPATAHC
jgi:glycosyltransferase involved in cell wall biosynthesis